MRYFCFLFFVILSCKTDKKEVDVETKAESTKSDMKKVHVDYQVQAFSHLQKENDTIINNLEEIINSHDYAKFWDVNDREHFRYPYTELHEVINDNYPAYQPTVIAIQKIKNDVFLLKIAMMGAPEGFNSINMIYNVYVVRNSQGNLVFKNTFDETVSSWKQKNVENITYYFDANRKIDVRNIEKQLEFENRLVKFLNVSKIDYKFFICKDAHQLYKLIGYDYYDSMFFNEQNGGLSYVRDKLIFSANNSGYNAHELTHLYISERFSETHSIIEEGVATYFGGSLELDYKQHLKILNDYIQKNNINIIEYLFDEDKRYTIIDFKTSIKYSCGALLCDLILKKKGKIGVYELMNSGKSDEELKQTLEKLFEIKIENLDAHLKTELNNILAVR